MQLKTRHRIAGGVFFAALAAIFIPMLFDSPPTVDVEIDALEPIEIDEVTEVPIPDVTNALTKRQELRDVIDEDGFLSSTGTKIGDPGLLEDSDAADSWAVQLGSFKSDSLANAFRTKLKQDGQPTWVSRAKLNGTVMTRVAVGPFQNRAEADEFRNLAKSRYDVDAVVVRFVP